MAAIGSTTSTLPIRCDACGTIAELRVSVTPHAVTDRSWEMHCRIVDADLIMLRLFAQAHRGGFSR
jgi:hypothetical protein